jgi:hypothetical protein
MKYTVHPIQAPTEHPLGEGEARFPITVGFVEEEIRAKYEAAHGWGGKVVAGYTMRCEPHEGLLPDEPALRVPSDFLFLVMELPDDWEEQRSQRYAQDTALAEAEELEAE